MIGGEGNDLNDPSFPSPVETPGQNVVDVSSSPSSFSPSSSENDLHETRTENDQSNDITSRELVLYNPVANYGGVAAPVSEPLEQQRQLFAGHLTSNYSPRVLPSVGAFTVQCADCFKWRLIPTKEKYEEIREHILEQPFYCKTARDWRPEICCDDPPDITQDGSRLWAIDKPNIAQPPPGWQRLLHIRGEGSTKFADVYYIAPSGKKLRSMVDIQKYLVDHPEYQTEGLSMARFSFQIPKPLQENYVRKRRAHINVSDGTKLLESGEVQPISWARPDDSASLQSERAGLEDFLSTTPVNRQAKKKMKRAEKEETRRRDDMLGEASPAVKIEERFG